MKLGKCISAGRTHKNELTDYFTKTSKNVKKFAKKTTSFMRKELFPAKNSNVCVSILLGVCCVRENGLLDNERGK